MEGIALLGNGSSEYIQTGERMQPKVNTLIVYVLCLTNYFL